MVRSAQRAIAIASLALLTLTSCTLASDTARITPVESAIRLGGQSSPSPSSTALPSTSSSATSDDDEGEDSDLTPANAVFDHDAELSIDDQVGNGKTVVINEFEVNIDHLWLVICTKSDRVLTASLTTNESKPVTLTLDTAITSSQELVAYLYLDNGDGRFDPALDSRVFEEPGELIEEDFEYEIG